MDAALLIVRLVIGLGLAVHGAQKLFGWFGGYGIAGTGGFFEGIGFKPGGALGPAAVLGVMLVAILTVHVKNGFLSTNNGWEMPALYVAGAFALPFTGFGAYSLDHAFGLTVLTSTASIWILYGLAVVQALLNAAIKKTPPAAPAT